MRRSPTRVTRLLAAGTAATLLLAACGGDDEPPLVPRIGEDDRADRETEPEPEPDPDPDPEPEPDPVEEEPEAADEPGDDEPHGWHIPESVFEINHDLDLDEDGQLELLRHLAAARAYTLEALDTLEWAEDQLRQYYADAELHGLLNGLAGSREEGHRQVTDGLLTEWAKVAQWGGGQAATLHCMRYGPEDGIFDVETGELIFQREDPHRLLAMYFALVETDNDEVDWRIVAGEERDDVACP